MIGNHWEMGIDSEQRRKQKIVSASYSSWWKLGHVQAVEMEEQVW